MGRTVLQGLPFTQSANRNRAGVFQTGQNIAQNNLVTLVQGTQEPQLQDGDIGYFLLIRNLVTLGAIQAVKAAANGKETGANA